MPTEKHFFRRQCGHQFRLALSTVQDPSLSEELLDLIIDMIFLRNISQQYSFNTEMSYILLL